MDTPLDKLIKVPTSGWKVSVDSRDTDCGWRVIFVATWDRGASEIILTPTQARELAAMLLAAADAAEGK